MNNKNANIQMKVAAHRALFSPKHIITKGDFIQIDNVFILKFTSLTDNEKNRNDLIQVMLRDYRGIKIRDFNKNINRYTIYYEVFKETLIGGIYDICTDTKLTQVVIIQPHASDAIKDSGYIYSPKSKFFVDLAKKI